MAPYDLHKLLENYFVFGVWTSHQRIKIFPFKPVLLPFFPPKLYTLSSTWSMACVGHGYHCLENQELDVEWRKGRTAAQSWHSQSPQGDVIKSTTEDPVQMWPVCLDFCFLTGISDGQIKETECVVMISVRYEITIPASMAKRFPDLISLQTNCWRASRTSCTMVIAVYILFLNIVIQQTNKHKHQKCNEYYSNTKTPLLQSWIWKSKIILAAKKKQILHML